jgi:hypothetical protein
MKSEIPNKRPRSGLEPESFEPLSIQNLPAPESQFNDKGFKQKPKERRNGRPGKH